MKQFTMQLNKYYQRPVVELKGWYGFTALLDTGAAFPIWTADETILVRVGGVLEKEGVKFKGFGGETTGNLYKLITFVMGIK